MGGPDSPFFFKILRPQGQICPGPKQASQYQIIINAIFAL